MNTVSLGRSVDPSGNLYAAALFRNAIHDCWSRQQFGKGVALACELIQAQRKNPPPPPLTPYSWPVP